MKKQNHLDYEKRRAVYIERCKHGSGGGYAKTADQKSMAWRFLPYELYTIMRYLQYDTIQKMGLGYFDSWAAAFGETVTSIELSPEGTGYRAKTRFARFYNLPELSALFKESADIQTANESGLKEDYEKGMKFATNGDYTANRTSSVITISSMNAYMNNHVPLIIAIGTYKNGVRDSGHAVVVCAVDTANKKFKVKDPEVDRDVTYSYSTITSSSESKRWDHTVKIY